MKSIRSVTDNQVCRSLLQKAVRRGAVSVVEKVVVHLLQKGEATWLRNRLGVIACEESWMYLGELTFTTNEEVLIKQYMDLASCSKNKNAAGLGSLAYELSKGVESVIVGDDINSKHIKIVAEAIRRPDDFWSWVKKNQMDSKGLKFLANAESGFKMAGWPWDKAFTLASAYLSTIGDIPQIVMNESSNSAFFPYWVAIDKHTSLGKRSLLKCAEKFSLDKGVLGWVQFYLESAKCENLQSSWWWEKEKKWRFESEGLGEGRAEAIWSDACVFLHELLFSKGLAIAEELDGSFDRYNKIMKNQGSLI